MFGGLVQTHVSPSQSDSDLEWKVIKPDVFAAIMDFFTTGLPVVNEDSVPSPDTGTCALLLSRCTNTISLCSSHGQKNADPRVKMMKPNRATC